MAEDNIRATDRRRHTRQSKGLLIQMLIITVIMLIALSAALLFRIQDLNKIIDNQVMQLKELSRIAAEQQVQMGELAEELQAVRNEKVIAEDKRPEPEKQEVGQKAETGNDVQQTVAQVTAAHKVYLTIDDGPSAHTQDILDILERYGVKATFFVVGNESDSAKEALKRIVEDGHTLGMHSYSHKYGEIYASLDNFAKDFAKLRDYLYEVTGVQCSIYRFPGGSSNTVKSRTIEMAEFARYLDSQGIRFFDWNISSGDGASEELPVETIVENCTANISRYSTSVVLMHDSTAKKTTLEALPTIIETILAMEDTVILPITDDTELIQHIKWQERMQ